MRRRDVFLLALPLFLLVSCAATVRQPRVPVEREDVILLTHGRSSSLILPSGDRGATRWAFGDWRYYAIGEKGVGASLAAVLWPTQSTLGRQWIDDVPDALEDLPAVLGIGIDRAFRLAAERDAVERLRRKLESIFDANRETLLYNPGPRLEFVQHPQPYTLRNSSNRKVAEWLRELGFTVSGVPLLSNWRVEDPSDAAVFRPDSP